MGTFWRGNGPHNPLAKFLVMSPRHTIQEYKRRGKSVEWTKAQIRKARGLAPITRD